MELDYMDQNLFRQFYARTFQAITKRFTYSNVSKTDSFIKMNNQKGYCFNYSEVEPKKNVRAIFNRIDEVIDYLYPDGEHTMEAVSILYDIVELFLLNYYKVSEIDSQTLVAKIEPDNVIINELRFDYVRSDVLLNVYRELEEREQYENDKLYFSFDTGIELIRHAEITFDNLTKIKKTTPQYINAQITFLTDIICAMGVLSII